MEELEAYKASVALLKERRTKLEVETKKAHDAWKAKEGEDATLGAWTQAIGRECSTDTAIYYLEQIIEELEA